MMLTSILALFAFSPVLADVYMQTMPGSNNRLDEQNRERANGNRMFDSQNNNRGGYNVGKMSYYKGELIPMKWTNQHGTQKYQMENSELILQYACHPLMRDGTTTQRIPIKPTECYNFDCDTDVRFGRHESIEDYELCQKTERNQGLFTANQNLKGNSAQYTRQNNNGNRRGLECPEERDYYPYWRPTIWRDALIITADPARCAEYQAESQNVKSKWQCKMPQAFFDAGGELPNNFRYSINGTQCVTQTLDVGDTTYTAEWQETPAWGIAAPKCVEAAQTRANHLGNPGGEENYGITWAIPDEVPDMSQCVTRLRYNITTADYLAWSNTASLAVGEDASTNSQKNNPNPNNDPAETPIWELVGLTREDVEGSFGNDNDASREYVLENNPQVDAFGDLLAGKITNTNAIKLQLAVNTAQFGRTFQDRSHTFFIKDRPAGVPANATIKLQTVKGKRGNIVQTFPAHEYFMEPTKQWVEQGTYVHWAWTGSNTNPNNNDGQGKKGTDRSNIIPTRNDQYSLAQYSNFDSEMTFEDGNRDVGSIGVSYPAWIVEPKGYEVPDQFQNDMVKNAFGGMSDEVMKMLGTTRQSPRFDYGNMEELDGAGTSFDLELQKVTQKGCTNYMCTRNHNFSNRDQKGKFCVSEGDVGEVMVSSAGGDWHDQWGRSGITFWPGASLGVQRAHITVKHKDKTDVVTVANVELVGTMTVDIGYSTASLHTATMYHQPECTTAFETDCNLPWAKVGESRVNMVGGGSVASADVQNTGTYKVINEPNWKPILALTVGLLAFVLALSYVLLNKCGDRCPAFLQRCQRNRRPKIENPTVQSEGNAFDTTKPGQADGDVL